MFLRCK